MKNKTIIEMTKRFGFLFFIIIFCFINVNSIYSKTKKQLENNQMVYSQWEFLKGNWKVIMSMKQKDGKIIKLKNPAYIKGYYHKDKITFQQEFSVPGSFFSTQVKAYNLKEKRWINKFINSKRQRWATTFSYWKDEKMVTIIPNGYSGKELYWGKEVDKEITKNRFVKYVYRSYDKGKTWSKTPYYILECKKILKN